MSLQSLSYKGSHLGVHSSPEFLLVTRLRFGPLDHSATNEKTTDEQGSIIISITDNKTEAQRTYISNFPELKDCIKNLGLLLALRRPYPQITLQRYDSRKAYHVCLHPVTICSSLIRLLFCILFCLFLCFPSAFVLDP